MIRTIFHWSMASSIGDQLQRLPRQFDLSH
jgi:hypothetical protein